MHEAPGLPPVAIVASRYNASVTDALVAGARSAFAERGGQPERVAVIPAAGAFETVALCAAAAAAGARIIVALGCIIRGETAHDRHLGAAVTSELANLSATHPVAVGLGVLTVETPEQARERAGGRLGNKGAEAMHAAIDTYLAMNTILRTPEAWSDPAALDEMRSQLEILARPAPDKAGSSVPPGAGGTR